MTKKQWASPRLSTHGSVETITQQVKAFGSADGIVLTTGEGLRNP